MRVFIFFVLFFTAVAALETCDDDCNRVCKPGGAKVCVFNVAHGCFSTYENCCAWTEMKCKYNLNHQIFRMEYCDLDNFACKQTK